MSLFERISVSVSDLTRPFASSSFNIPIVIGTTENVLASKDTLKRYTADDLTAVALDFPTTTPEYETIVAILSQDPHPDTVYAYSITRSATPLVTDLSTGFLAALTAIEEGGFTDPYFVVLATHEEVAGDLAELADSVSAKTMILVSSNKTGENSTEIMARSAALNSDRVVLIAHTDPDTERVDAAMVGYAAGSEVGSITWDTKALKSVAAAEFSRADVQAFTAALGTAGAVIPFVNQGGVPVTIGSCCTDGTYADMRRSKDWLKAKIEEGIFHLKLNNLKIPQDDHGIHMVQSAIEGVLNRANEKGILQQRGSVGRWEIDIPSIEWLVANDPTALTNRHLRTVRVRVWPIGAFEAFTIYVYLNWEAAS